MKVILEVKLTNDNVTDKMYEVMRNIFSYLERMQNKHITELPEVLMFQVMIKMNTTINGAVFQLTSKASTKSKSKPLVFKQQILEVV